MAIKTLRVDDIDGKPDAEEVEITVNGATWALDLSQHNLTKLLNALAPFTENARVVRKPRKAIVTANGSGERGYDAEKLRRWADEHSIQLPRRGRIPGVIVDQYLAAGGR